MKKKAYTSNFFDSPVIKKRITEIKEAIETQAIYEKDFAKNMKDIYFTKTFLGFKAYNYINNRVLKIHKVVSKSLTGKKKKYCLELLLELNIYINDMLMGVKPQEDKENEKI